MRRDRRRLIAVDSEGHEIRINDNMKEIRGESREGRVLHVYQSHHAFLHNRGLLESGGVFVTQAMELVSVSPRHRFSEPWRTVPKSSRALASPHPNAGGATSRICNSITPTPTPYVGSSTPAWNPHAQTPLGIPRAQSLFDYSVTREGETSISTSIDCMDLIEDVSDPYGKLCLNMSS